jgi:hypothetical protein
MLSVVHAAILGRDVRATMKEVRADHRTLASKESAIFRAERDQYCC